MFTRRAGEGLDLDPDVVVYMGRAAQGMPQDEGMDQRIADGFTRAVQGTGIRAELLRRTRTLEIPMSQADDTRRSA